MHTGALVAVVVLALLVLVVPVVLVVLARVLLRVAVYASMHVFAHCSMAVSVCLVLLLLVLLGEEFNSCKYSSAVNTCLEHIEMVHNTLQHHVSCTSQCKLSYLTQY